VVAHNFAPASENRIHDDEVARRLGFAGGLVPGVASYAYLVRPVYELLGAEWVQRGEIEVKLVHPVYDGDLVEAEARRTGAESDQIELELRDSSGSVCATGVARVAARHDDAALDQLPYVPPPPLDARPPADLEELRPGRALASLDEVEALFRQRDDAPCAADPPIDAISLRRYLADRYRDDLAVFLDPGGPLHPALVPELANQVLARSVRLGPWIHASSRVTHFAPLAPPLHARGRVAAAYTRHGHEIVELDVDVCAGPAGASAAARRLARVRHRAIVRPRALAVAG
jgi:hypothetical protein